MPKRINAKEPKEKNDMSSYGSHKTTAPLQTKDPQQKTAKKPASRTKK
ncbi:MAG: hypothetical protein ABIA04_00170 [Pseudomonadota bacterium]